jgi:hypothetical protein
MVDSLSTGTATCKNNTPSTNAVAAGALPDSPMAMRAILDYAATTPSPFNGSTSSPAWYGGDRTKQEILKNVFDQFNNQDAFGRSRKELDEREWGPTRPHFVWRIRPAQSSWWRPNATTKPSVVAIPTSFRPCWKASGIIVSASIARIPPAANVRMKATVSGDASSKRL